MALIYAVPFSSEIFAASLLIFSFLALRYKHPKTKSDNSIFSNYKAWAKKSIITLFLVAGQIFAN